MIMAAVTQLLSYSKKKIAIEKFGKFMNEFDLCCLTQDPLLFQDSHLSPDKVELTREPTHNKGLANTYPLVNTDLTQQSIP